MSKQPNQNPSQNPVKKAEPQLAKDPKIAPPQANQANAKQPQKTDGKPQPPQQQQQGKGQEQNKAGQQQLPQKGSQQTQSQPTLANKQQQQQQLQQQQEIAKNEAIAKQQELLKQQEAIRKQEKKQKKQEYFKQQKEYFDSLYREMQTDNLEDLVEGKQIVNKVNNKNIKKIEYGILTLEGILFRKGNMIEEDQIDSLLLEAYKERDLLKAQIQNAQQVISDCENQLVDVPNSIQISRKPNIVEEAVLDKKIQDYKKQKDEYEKKLRGVEKNIQNLQSQRIDNPKSAYGHAGLQAYLEQQDTQKKREASQFIKKIKDEKKVFDEKMKKIENEQQAKQLQEEQDKLAKEARSKMIQEKEKEDQLKKRIKEIQQDKVQRLKESESHEEQYKLQKDKMNNGKSPLYLRLNKQYRSQLRIEEQEKQKNLDVIKENHKRIDEMNLFEHQQKYLDKLKQQEEDRLQERKRKDSELKEHLQKVSSFPSSTVWTQKEEVLFNQPQDQKIRAQKIVEARNHFAEGVKKKKKVNIDEQKRLEMQIKIDKMNNPSKYIKPQRRRRNSNDSQYENSEEYDRFDEKVFKNEIKMVERGKGKYIDKGLEYLEEAKEAAKEAVKEAAKEAAKSMPKKARSEQPLSRQDKTQDSISDVKNGSQSSNFQMNSSQMKSKIDYMQEVRSKFGLDKKSTEQKDWEKISLSQNGIDPYEKKKNLLRISKKLDEEAKHQELLYNIQKSNDKTSGYTLKDVQSREKIDEMYLESIKAKLAIFDSYHQSSSPKTNQTQPEHSQGFKDFKDNSVLSQ